MRTSVTIAGIGDSLMAGAFARFPDSTMMARIVLGLRREYGLNLLHVPNPLGYGGLLGGIYLQWHAQVRQWSPDIVIFQGGENEQGNNNVTGLPSGANGVGPATARILFDGAPSSNQLYHIGYNDPSGGEWVLVRNVSGNEGQNVERGLFGTVPRRWPALTPVVNDAGVTWNGTAWKNRFEHVLREVARTGALVLVGGLWFEAHDGAKSEFVRSVCARLRGEGYHVRFVPYAKKDGTGIFTDVECKGPSATFTGAFASADSSTVVMLTGGSTHDFTVNEYVLVSSSQAPTSVSHTETCKVTAKDAGSLTLARGQLSSGKVNLTAGSTKYIGQLSKPLTHPSNKWLGINETTTNLNNTGWCLDNHPNDRGHAELGEAFLRALREELG